MDRIEKLINELAYERDVTVMSLEEFLAMLTANIDDDENQLTIDLDNIIERGD